MTGIFKQSRYVYVGYGDSLQYFRTNWNDNLFLTDANITCKLTTHLALTRASRVSMIQHLNRVYG